LALVQGLISGTQKHFPSGSFTLGNVTYTTATLVQAQGSHAVDQRAAGRQGGEAARHARRAWDDEQEAKARHQG
jgi:hypothetical protein